MSKVTTLARGHLSDRLLVGNVTLSLDGLTSSSPHPPASSCAVLSWRSYKVANTCNFLHWFRWTLDHGVGIDHPPTILELWSSSSDSGTVSLDRSSCFCFAFKQWCWCNKTGIISRQSTCLRLYSSSIKLVQSITWAYWSEFSAVERAVCKINALFSPRLALFMLDFLSVKMRGKQGRNRLPPLYFILSIDFSESFWQIQPCFLSSLWPTYFFTPYLNGIRQHESTSL